MKAFPWFALIWLLHFSTAEAASFDCAKAQSKVEHLICDNQEISKLDEELNTAYSLAQSRSEGRQTTIKEQRQWLRAVRNACSDANCLKDAYISRINKLANAETVPKIARKTAKHALPMSKAMEEFESFIKEREFLDDPYEIASPEAEELLQFIERLLLEKSSVATSSANKEYQLNWTKEFIAYLRKGNGDFVRITEGVYIVQSYFLSAYLSGIFVADMHAPEFRQLAHGYGLEVSESGYLPDGTGWILAPYGGLTSGMLVGGVYVITFFNSENSTYVNSINPVGYSREYGRECEDKIGHEWADTNNDGQRELIFTVEEQACGQARKSNTTRLVYSISNGRVTELR